jgi:hypothetical protein
MGSHLSRQHPCSAVDSQRQLVAYVQVSISGIFHESLNRLTLSPSCLHPKVPKARKLCHSRNQFVEHDPDSGYRSGHPLSSAHRPISCGGLPPQIPSADDLQVVRRIMRQDSNAEFIGEKRYESTKQRSLYLREDGDFEAADADEDTSMPRHGRAIFVREA